MFGKKFQLNSQNLEVIEEIGKHMHGGFFIYKEEDPGELLYANHAVFDIFGCSDIDEFRELTGYTFSTTSCPSTIRPYEPTEVNHLLSVGFINSYQPM